MTDHLHDAATVMIAAPQMDLRLGQKLGLREVLFPPLALEGLNAFELLRTLEGAVLILASFALGESHVYGSAVLVGPGIALAAGHVIEEHQAKGHLTAPDPALYAFGPAGERTHAWIVSEIKYNSVGDVAVLVMQYAADMPDDLEIHYFATCARLPEISERVTAIGFRPVNALRLADPETRELGLLEGTFLTSSGPISDLWPLGRDALLPRPSFAAQLTTVGAMSGGPVLNAQGKLIGIVSRSIDAFEEEPAVTSATMIWDGLFEPIAGQWPPKFWPAEATPLADLINPEDRWRLHWSVETMKFRYQANGDAPDPSLYAPFTDGEDDGVS